MSCLNEEDKQNIRRATECTVLVEDRSVIGGGYTICSFCYKEAYSNDIEDHYKDCLVHKLEKIYDKLIEDD